MFQDTQRIHATTTRTKIKKNKRRHTDPLNSDTSSTTSSDRTSRSDNEEMTINSEFCDPLPPSDFKELRNIEGGEYFLPSADKNIERLQMQHFLIRCTWASNYSTPTEEIFASGSAKVLDVQ
jgi:hypothetical protein